MKDEEEKMHEFMKDFTNAHDNLPKVMITHAFSLVC